MGLDEWLCLCLASAGRYLTDFSFRGKSIIFAKEYASLAKLGQLPFINSGATYRYSDEFNLLAFLRQTLTDTCSDFNFQTPSKVNDDRMEGTVTFLEDNVVGLGIIVNDSE